MNDLFKSDKILIEVSRDGLKGYLTLISEDNQLDEPFYYEEVLKIIKDVIKVDIDEKVIKDMIHNKLYNDKICIAKGKEPVDGVDGHIKYYFKKKERIIPKVKEDGTVDYRDLDMINNVNKGDILAEIIPPKDGVDGIKVTGEIIPYKIGKTPFFKLGRNVVLSDDRSKLLAGIDGQVKFSGDKILVTNILNIESVDNSTGNVDFNGTVKIKKNVLSGFRVKAAGDIEVSGVVEGAFLESGGNILIRKGIQGYNCANIYAFGNITSNYIENSIIYCNQNLTAEAIMHSEITCKEDIYLIGKKGLIVGGICRARNKIQAKTIGSRMATSTVVEVGVDPDLKLRFEELQKNTNELRINLEKVHKSVVLLDSLEKSDRLDDDKRELYKKLIFTKRKLEEEYGKANREFVIVKAKLSDTYSGLVKVEGTIFPGVKIVIGNSVMFIRDEMNHCTFFRDDGDIKVGPY